MKNHHSLAAILLRLSLGIFFLTLGVQGLSEHTSTTAEILRWFGRNDALSMAISVIQILAGAVLCIGIILPVGNTVSTMLTFGVLLLWGIYIVMTLFLQDFLRPDTLAWIHRTSWSFVIFTSLWVVHARL